MERKMEKHCSESDEIPAKFLNEEYQFGELAAASRTNEPTVEALALFGYDFPVGICTGYAEENTCIPSPEIVGPSTAI